ncbi:MAG: [protein-PII] uridylyltransferase [Pseudomonadales bacterium]|jgi:[protein-PII] uridylyltransferase|nr:[protein-PII] uridylyltransferase [Pseudomonadales bacterium]
MSPVHTHAGEAHKPSSSTPPRSGNRRQALFNLKEFQRQLGSGAAVIATFKDQLKHSRALLDARFVAGEAIEQLIQDQSWLIDQILTQAWRRYRMSGADDISLVAVGGYGRGELHPYSDIDIQILLARGKRKKYQASIEAFLTFLWDINLEVGQSVRSIADNIKEAAKDITSATALLESRTVAGNARLHEQLLLQLSQKKIWKHASFFAAKKAEQVERHRKYDDIEYSLEPNLKVAPGGLRDIHTISWIARHYLGTGDFKQLVLRGFLLRNEYRELVQARQFLWTLRYALHMLNHRREDRLLFENQRRIAELFGYANDSKSLATEKLMQQYYQVVLTVRRLNDLLLQLFEEEILTATLTTSKKASKKTSQKTKIVALNERFLVCGNVIEVKHNRVFQKEPMALLEIFVLMARHRDIDTIRASTIRLLRNALHLIDDAYRHDARNTAMFMELLRSPHHMVAILRKMKHYGILSAYLPEFGRVVGQMQHDLFHIYTVDDHTLQVMENMRRFRHPQAKNRFPISSQIIHQLPKPELLYIAGLYHDIAKGRGGNHSLLGMQDAEDFCQRHHLGKWDTMLVVWLVEHHLLMSSTAQREDIHDPEVIKNFARKVSDQTRLDYLLLLTVADINGTNPNLWNTWRASLLRKLYVSTKRALAQGLEITVGKDARIEEAREQALALLEHAGIAEAQALHLWQGLGDDYFLRESPQDILWQTQAVAAEGTHHAPLIVIRNTTDIEGQEGASQIFIRAPHTAFLFANLSTACERLNFTIVDARLYPLARAQCYITFMVLEADGTPLQLTKPRLIEIEHKLRHYVVATQALPGKQHHSPTRKQRHLTRSTVTTLTNNENKPYSILEVLCLDRPGLLAVIGHIFVEMNITMHSAKITTLGENVEDVFFIVDEHKRPLRDPSTIDTLLTRIRERLDAELRY